MASQQGNRGMMLESLLTTTCMSYEGRGVAVIRKVPTPMKIKAKKGNFFLCQFGEKSTVDYIGCYKGRYICFDAKECEVTSFPLKNIHHHQLVHLKQANETGGIAFLIIFMGKTGKYYRLMFNEIEKFFIEYAGEKIPDDRILYERLVQNASRKSIPLKFIEDNAKEIPFNDNGYVLNFLEVGR